MILDSFSFKKSRTATRYQSEKKFYPTTRDNPTSKGNCGPPVKARRRGRPLASLPGETTRKRVQRFGFWPKDFFSIL